MTYKRWAILYLIGLILGLSGLVIVGINAGWKVAGGVFLLVYGNTLTRPILKK